MQLAELVTKYRELGAGFPASFPRPFLLEPRAEGRSRQAFYLDPAGDRGLVVGIEANADVALSSDGKVSPRHAELIPPSVEGEPWQLLDTGSREGTTLNGVPLEDGQRRALDDQDSIGFGPLTTLVFMVSASFQEILAREVQGEVPAALAAPSARPIKGDLSTLGLGTLLLGIERKQKSGRVEIVSELLSGTITFQAGKPWSAEDDTGRSGVPAIKALLGLSKGRFTVDPNHPVQGERRIGLDFLRIMRTRG